MVLRITVRFRILCFVQWLWKKCLSRVKPQRRERGKSHLLPPSGGSEVEGASPEKVRGAILYNYFQGTIHFNQQGSELYFAHHLYCFTCSPACYFSLPAYLFSLPLCTIGLPLALHLHFSFLHLAVPVKLLCLWHPIPFMASSFASISFSAISYYISCSNSAWPCWAHIHTSTTAFSLSVLYSCSSLSLAASSPHLLLTLQSHQSLPCSISPSVPLLNSLQCLSSPQNCTTSFYCFMCCSPVPLSPCPMVP